MTVLPMQLTVGIDITESIHALQHTELQCTSRAFTHVTKLTGAT